MTRICWMRPPFSSSHSVVETFLFSLSLYSFFDAGHSSKGPKDPYFASSWRTGPSADVFHVNRVPIKFIIFVFIIISTVFHHLHSPLPSPSSSGSSGGVSSVPSSSPSSSSPFFVFRVFWCWRFW